MQWPLHTSRRGSSKIREQRWHFAWLPPILRIALLEQPPLLHKAQLSPVELPAGLAPLLFGTSSWPLGVGQNMRKQTPHDWQSSLRPLISPEPHLLAAPFPLCRPSKMRCHNEGRNSPAFPACGRKPFEACSRPPLSDLRKHSCKQASGIQLQNPDHARSLSVPLRYPFHIFQRADR